MIVTLISFKDKQLKIYTMPQATQLVDDEAIIEDCRAAIIKSSNRDVFKRKDLVKIGTYDTVTGKIKASDPEFLLNCDEVISAALDYEKSSQN